MRIDGITDKLKAGDKVVKMREYEIVDMMAYMKVLSKFDKGQSGRYYCIAQRKEHYKTSNF